MPKPFDADLRARIVYQVLILNRSLKQVALDNFVSKRTVSRYLKRVESGMPLKALPNPGKPPVIRGERAAHLTYLVSTHPTISLREIQVALARMGIILGLPMISRTLKSLGFGRQTLARNANQRSDFLRAAYLQEVCDLQPKQLVFFDEMGAVRTTCVSFF